MYVCTYVYMYVCVYVCMCVCMYVCMYTCIHVNMYTCTHVYMYTCTHVYMYTHIHVQVYKYILGLFNNRNFGFNLPPKPYQFVKTKKYGFRKNRCILYEIVNSKRNMFNLYYHSLIHAFTSVFCASG